MANGAQERNRKFTLGFLNTAQDANDADQVNTVVLDGVDLDKLALGTVQSSGYKDQGVGAPDWQTTKIVGDDFRINAGDIEFLESEGPDVWADIDGYLTAPGPVTIIIEESNGGVNYINSGSWVGFVESDITVEGEKGSANPNLSNTVMINPSNYSRSNQTFTYIITVQPGGTTYTSEIVGVGTFGPYAIAGVSGANTGYQDVGYSVNLAMDSALSYSSGDTYTFDVAQDLLEDGDYFYSVSEVTHIKGKDIESLYSTVETARIRNENNLGALVSYGRPLITVARDVANDKWVYRKGPRDEEWYRIAIVSSGSGDAEFVDNILTSSLIDTRIIEDLNPVSMATLLDAADSTSWGYIFEKDNRLWAVPSQKKDVVFYSEPLEWWRWTKANSIGFNGDFRGTASLRDSNNVSVQNTAVFVTSSGLYNVYGNGSDDEPYVRVTHEANFGTVQDSLVKANNMLYMISDGTSYQDGEWGRKLYSYDLTRLEELSGIVQNSDPFVDNAKTISYVNQIGGNKLKILMSDNTMMIYHIKADGFGESNTTTETNSDWHIRTATFHPSFAFNGKFHNVDKFRMEWNGSIDIEWFVEGQSQGVTTYTNASRGWDEFMLPGLFGGNCSLDIKGDNGAVLYDLYMVSAK
jgi:hypothetical protein